MYAVIRRFHVGRDDMDDTLQQVDVAYASAVERQMGFADYQLVRTGPDEVFSVMLFEDRDQVERNRSFTEAFLEVGLAAYDVRVLDKWAGDVAVSRANKVVLAAVPSEQSPLA